VKCKILYLEYNKVGDLYLPCIGTNCNRMCGVVCCEECLLALIGCVVDNLVKIAR
jgi:hypothetical protein